MSLEINVDHAYAKPDLYIHGLVTSWPDDREIPYQAVSFLVDLTGRTQTRVEGADGKIHEECITFFEMAKEVYSGRSELRWGYQTSYSLHLPNDPAAPAPAEGDMFLPWNHDKPSPQVLPPSGEYGKGNIVIYEAQARILDDSQRIREIKSNCVEVKFSQTRVEEDVDYAMTRLHHKEQTATAATIEEGMASEVTLELPQNVFQDGTFPIVLSLASHDSASGYSLRSCSLKLIENTLIVCGNEQKHTSNSIELGSWSATDCTGTALPSIARLDGTLDLGKILRYPKIPSSCTPSFSSGNIQRSYAFDVLVELLDGEQECSLRFSLDPLVVLPGETDCQAKAQQGKEVEAANEGWD